MPTLTINGVQLEFNPGEKILQVAKRAHADGEDTHIPYYCYHDGLSIPAQCRICLVEIWAPNARNDNKLEPQMGGKLQPACSTDAADGMVVYAGSPRAVANQKAVMEYLLINHPLDCPVCDQAGECELQDYSFKFGRGVSRFEETKVKQPKKDLGPHVYIYSDRCIMCTRCVRFAREIPETGELLIDGRGNQSQIDVFPGVALDNELSANVIDLCPVGALLDKDFLFAQRVWFLKSTPSIDGITASGDNILIEHNEGTIYRIKPRTNLAINQHWITDEVRYGWKFVHSDRRFQTPLRRQYGTLVETDWARAADQALDGMRERSIDQGKRLGVVISPMLTCEEAYALATLARSIDDQAVLTLGPIPYKGEDKHFPPSADKDAKGVFHMHAEKAPNARGVRRVLKAVTGQDAIEFDDFRDTRLADCGAVIVTGNYPFAGEWNSDGFTDALKDKHVTLIDTLESPLQGVAEVVLPAATFAEKAGTFENARNMLQAFEQAIPTQHESKSEGQIAADLAAMLEGRPFARPKTTAADAVIDEGPGQVPAGADVAALPRAALFNAANTRQHMADAHPDLKVFLTDVAMPAADRRAKPDVELIDL